MPFVPSSANESATPDANEVLVSGTDTTTGLPQNVLLRNAPELKARLLATPPIIPNPARPAVEKEAFAAATAHLEAEAKVAAERAAADEKPA